MSWAKGPMPGATPKADCLSAYPGRGLHCRHETRGDISAYCVIDGSGDYIACRGNAQEAWAEAHSRLDRHPTDENKEQL